MRFHWRTRHASEQLEHDEHGSENSRLCIQCQLLHCRYSLNAHHLVEVLYEPPTEKYPYVLNEVFDSAEEGVSRVASLTRHEALKLPA